MLRGKKILLGITGSIAAYKSILIVRLLVSAGAEVRIIMTPAARDFVSSLTLATLSKYKVLHELADEDTWANHVMLGRWADVMVIAPLSCNTLAKMAAGICDNLLMATCLSAVCPVVVAPAMDEDMWKHPATERNIESLISFGYSVISVVKGELASGLYGEGRMAEPNDIVTFLVENYFRGDSLTGKSILITAGPTYEALDPVRFIGNHSSGKMGIALAEAFYENGAHVDLICGPVDIDVRYNGIKVKRVTTAKEMYNECLTLFPQKDIAVMAAAVADYTPVIVADQKIKKSSDNLNIELTKTQDILKSLGSIKSDDQFLVGFALETENENEYALSKLTSKNADLIVLNSLKDETAGFKKDTNKVTIFDAEKNIFVYEAKSKKLVADDIVDLILKKLMKKQTLLVLLFITIFHLFNYGQELQSKVTVIASRVPNTVDKKVFQTLQTQLTNFINNRKWTADVVQPQERIECSFLLNVESVVETNVYKASLTIQAARPVFNSSYSTALINFQDADVTFRYVEYQPVEFNENRVQGTDALASNLTATFAYYINIILGLDYNSFGPKGGDLYFQKAQNIVNNAPENRNISGWKAFDGSRNRYWLAENFLNTRFNLVHDVIYNYYRLGMDFMYENQVEARTKILNSLTQLQSVNQDNPNSMVVQFFMIGKSQELIQIFKKASAQDKSRAIEALQKLDVANVSKYQQELK